MNPPPSPCSGDVHDDSKSGELDELVVRFLKELEGSGDAKEVLARYCSDYPSWPVSSVRWPDTSCPGDERASD